MREDLFLLDDFDEGVPQNGNKFSEIRIWEKNSFISSFVCLFVFFSARLIHHECVACYDYSSYKTIILNSKSLS